MGSVTDGPTVSDLMAMSGGGGGGYAPSPPPAAMPQWQPPAMPQWQPQARPQWQSPPPQPASPSQWQMPQWWQQAAQAPPPAQFGGGGGGGYNPANDPNSSERQQQLRDDPTGYNAWLGVHNSMQGGGGGGGGGFNPANIIATGQNPTPAELSGGGFRGRGIPQVQMPMSLGNTMGQAVQSGWAGWGDRGQASQPTATPTPAADAFLDQPMSMGSGSATDGPQVMTTSGGGGLPRPWWALLNQATGYGGLGTGIGAVGGSAGIGSSGQGGAAAGPGSW